MPVKNRQINPSVNWIDITSPTESELKDISDKYQLNWHQVKNCMHPDHLPSYENIGNAMFIITRFFSVPAILHLHTLQELTSKIAVFYNEDTIITIHRSEITFIEQEIGETCLQEEVYHTPSNIFALVLFQGLKTYETAARRLSDQVDEYEKNILLKTLKPPMLKGLYFLKRKAGIGKRLMLLTKEVIRHVNTLEVADNTKRDIADLELKLETWFEQILDDVNNLLNTYLSLSAHKTNDVMKILTIFSVFFMPLTFIVGVYGMNFRMPEVKMEHGYTYVWILMIIVTILTYIWFRKKRWL